MGPNDAFRGASTVSQPTESPSSIPRRIGPYATLAVSMLSLWAVELSPGGLAADEPADAPQAPATPASSATAKAQWFGTIITKTAHLRTYFELARQLDGRWTGTSISLDQRAARIPVEKIEWTAERLIIELPTVDAWFEGQLSADGQRAVGTFRQRGIDLPLTLDLVDKIPAPPEPDEVWLGELQAGLLALKLQVRRLPSVGEQPAVDLLDSLTEGITGLVANVNQTESEWKVEIPAIKATFSGTFDDQRRSASGWWRQGVLPLPMKFERVERALTADSVRPKRPQTPQPPFPYESLPVSIVVSPTVTLAGTLTRPTGEGPFPALVLVSGSGPQDRDETIFDHKPFAVLADALTRHGIAVLRYDDRGVGESVGEFATATTDDFTGDAWAAWQWLANQPQIDPDRIGIGGHSEGALVASLLAGEHTDPAFVLLLAPPGVNGDRITRTQTMAMAIAEGASRAAADRIGQLLGDVNRLAKQRSEVDDEYRGKLKLLIDECAADLESLGEPLQPAERAALESGLTALPSPWYRRFLTLEPQAALEHVQRPVLAILGQFDLQVPAKENAAALRTALQGNDRATVAIIEGINHLLQPSTKGVPSEYAVQETTIAPAVLEKIVQWVSDQVAPTSSGN